MRKKVKTEQEDLEATSHEHSLTLRKEADDAMQRLQDILERGFSDSSDSNSESDSDDGDKESVQSDHSVSMSTDEEEKGLNGDKDTESDEKVSGIDDIDIDDQSIPVFAYQVLEPTDICPIPTEFINLFTERKDLFWSLQNNLLVEWYQSRKQTMGFPVTVAKTLYSMVYSSDDLIMSIKAGDTLSFLYEKCSIGDKAFWSPTLLELRQGLKYLSHQDTSETMKHRISCIATWTKVVKSFFNSMHLTDLSKQSTDIAAMPRENSGSESPTASTSLSVKDILLFWRDLMMLCVQKQVVDEGMSVVVLDAAQSILRSLFRDATRYKLNVGLSSSPMSTILPSPTSKGQNGFRGLGGDRQGLAVDVHNAIWSLYSLPFRGTIKHKKRSRKSDYSKSVKMMQDLVDQIELLSIPQNVDVGKYGGTILHKQHSLLQQEQCCQKFILSIQLSCVEAFLLRYFGESRMVSLSVEEESFVKFISHQRDTVRVVKFQPYSDVKINAPSGNILCMFDAALSNSSGQPILAKVAIHYLQQCSLLLGFLYTSLKPGALSSKELQLKDDDGSVEDEMEDSYSLDKNMELIYVLFKHVNLVFNLVLETVFTRVNSKSYVLAESPSKKRQLNSDPSSSDFSNKSPLKNGASDSPSQQPNNISGVNLEDVAKMCSKFVDKASDFMPILRKRMRSLGLMTEISHIVGSIEDKWDFVKVYFLLKNK